MNIEETIPVLTTGATRTNETVGTGDDSATDFYLDKAYVLADTYTLFHGSASNSTAEFTETTHYTLTKDNGTIVLTSAGVTLLSTDNIYGKYSYCGLELTDTQLQDALDRAQAEIDERTNNHWATGTDATPDYTQVTNEKHTGQGKYNRDYFLNNFPLPDVSSSLTSNVLSEATTIYIDSTSGFPSVGYLSIEDDKIQYTGKTTTSVTGCTDVSAHSTSEIVYPFVFEFSTTLSGSTATWTPLAEGSDYDLDQDSGKVHLYRADYDSTYYATQYPSRLIPNRFRASYAWGNETIPKDINRLCLLIAAKDLMGSTLRRSILKGQSGDRKDNIDFDESWINETISRYDNIQTSNI